MECAIVISEGKTQSLKWSHNCIKHSFFHCRCEINSCIPVKQSITISYTLKKKLTSICNGLLQHIQDLWCTKIHDYAMYSCGQTTKNNKQTNKQAVKQTKGHNIVMLKNVNAKSKRKIIPNRFGFRFLFLHYVTYLLIVQRKKHNTFFFSSPYA